MNAILTQDPAQTRYEVTSHASGDSTYAGARVIHDTGNFVRNKDVTDHPSPSITNGVAGMTAARGHNATLLIEGANGFNGHAGTSLNQPMPTVQASRPVQPLDGPGPLRAFRDARGAFGDAGDISDRPSPPVLAGSVGTHWLEAETDISRYAIGREWDTLAPGEQSQRYFQLVKPSLDKPCPTVTQLGGNNTVASVCHPTEKRKFTIAELKRICAFPDDFVLIGSYAQQWARLGNAVPPVMMYHLARCIRDDVLQQGTA